MDRIFGEKLNEPCLKQSTPGPHGLHRTEDWVGPEVQPSEAKINSVVEDFRELDLERQRQTEQATSADTVPLTTTKMKPQTRGTPRQNGDQVAIVEDEQEEQTQMPTPILTSKKRAIKVFNVFFHNPFSGHQPGEIAWSDF